MKNEMFSIACGQIQADSLHNHFGQIGAKGRMTTSGGGATSFEWERIGEGHLKRLAGWSEGEAKLIREAQAR